MSWGGRSFDGGKCWNNRIEQIQRIRGLRAERRPELHLARSGKHPDVCLFFFRTCSFLSYTKSVLYSSSAFPNTYFLDMLCPDFPPFGGYSWCVVLFLRCQMRFMKYVYAHVDGQKAARAHTRLMAQLVGEEKSADKLLESRQSHIRRKGSKEVTLAALGKADVGTLASSGRRREKSARGTVLSQPDGGGGIVGNRQRLLEKKRRILLEMKGVVSRQAEALDRLVESSADINRAAQAGGRGGDNNNRRQRSFQGSHGGSTKSSSVPHAGTESGRRSSKALSKAAPSTRRASCLDVSNFVVRKTPAMPPPRPPENDTSAFLARGGRWGGEGRQGTSSRRDSLASASSASYATYCNRGPARGAAALKSSRRPAVIPALPV